jgi:P2 family phage contractile tail tube protein
MIKTNKVTNAVVYLDGESFIGRAEEITCPEVAPKMIDHKALGLIGDVELATTAIGKMSSKIKWNSIYVEAMKKTHNPFQALRLQIRANVDTYENQSLVGQIPCVIKMTAVAKKAGGLVFKANDNVEREDEFNVTAYSMAIDGEEIIAVDVMANIWRVNGVDLLASFRDNIGQ